MSTSIRLSALIADGDGWRDVAEKLTGVAMDLPLSKLLEPLALPYDVIDPVKTEIWRAHDDAVAAAFAAGLTCGLNPERLLIEVQL